MEFKRFWSEWGSQIDVGEIEIDALVGHDDDDENRDHMFSIGYGWCRILEHMMW